MNGKEHRKNKRKTVVPAESLFSISEAFCTSVTTLIYVASPRG
jgi:hypothetical protein